MYNDGQRFGDGVAATPAGMNSGVSPSLLSRSQVALAVNTTFRSGYAETRPGFKQNLITFETQEQREWFEAHPTQGAYVYDPPNGNPVLVCSSGGRFFEFRIANGAAQAHEFTPESGRNSQNRFQVWFQQAAQYLVIQDGYSLPIIYDGASARRSDPEKNEVPTGKQMAYGNWRLFVVLQDGRQILAGDFAYVTPTSVLEFTETTYLQGGGSLAVPTEQGAIRALLFTAVNNTTSGQGPLLACMQRSVISFNPIPQRAAWETLNPFSSIALLNAGFESQGGMTTVNGDLWGRSFDGIRSLVMASREFSGWGNTPMSREMNRILDDDTPNLVEFASSIYFDNRLLMTCHPVALAPGGAYHRGIIALNFENVTSIGNSSQAVAAYDGLWTGIQPYQLVTGLIDGQTRAFAFCRSTDDGKTELWEITKDEPMDNSDRPITSVIETPSLGFKYPTSMKRLVDGELWVDNLEGTTTFDIKFRPDENPTWSNWTATSECAPVGFCDSNFTATPCAIFSEAQSQYRRIYLGAVPKTNDPVLNKPYTDGYAQQIRIEWTGHARLQRLLIYCTLTGDPIEGVE